MVRILLKREAAEKMTKENACAGSVLRSKGQTHKDWSLRLSLGFFLPGNLGCFKIAKGGLGCKRRITLNMCALGWGDGSVRKVLACKHEDPCSDLQHPCKMSGVEVYPCNTISRGK